MRALSILGPLFFAAASLAQAVEEGIAPDAPPPEGCETTADSNFTIAVVNSFSAENSKRETALEASAGALTCTLDDGVLRDQYGRTGSIVANRQFQFDGPPQAGAIYTGGFSVCQNKSLAIGSSTRWWRCMSGEFGNLYDESIGGQCKEIRIVVSYVDDESSSSSSSSASASPTASIISEDNSASSSATPTASGSDSSSSGQSSFTPPASTASLRPTEQGQSENPPAPTAGIAPYQIPDRSIVAVLFGLAIFL